VFARFTTTAFDQRNHRFDNAPSKKVIVAVEYPHLYQETLEGLRIMDLRENINSVSCNAWRVTTVLGSDGALITPADHRRDRARRRNEKGVIESSVENCL